jgi:hypothetical protein
VIAVVAFLAVRLCETRSTRPKTGMHHPPRRPTSPLLASHHGHPFRP